MLTAGSAEAAAPSVRFAVPPGSLYSALARFARQAEIDIGGIEPGLARIPFRGLSGRMTIDAGLKRLLEGTAFEARAVVSGTYRLVRRATPPPPRPGPAPTPVALAPKVDTGGGDIVVTGGKREVPLANYPGSAAVILLGEGAFGPPGLNGQSFLLRQSPILQSTELGAGRNKLFIRGVADSSFTGPTQSTAGTYFGDVRTGYNGPDPNLNLFDVDRVEVLEGPQGTLYGAGSIGGVIRLAPHAPDASGTHAAFNVGASSVSHGGIGNDVAGMINLAPMRDKVALRIVAYRSVDAGYMDDPDRGQANINRITESGARATLRIEPADGWSLEAGSILQKGRQPDLQYGTVDGSSLTRRSAIPQPFSHDYKLARAVLSKEWDSGLRLLATTGRVIHDTTQRYDVTRPGRFANPVAYDEQNRMRLTTQEVRLSRQQPDGRGWLIGAAYLRDTTAKAREIGFLDAQRDLIGVTNRTKESSVFANGTEMIGSRLSVTAGARYTDARMDGDPSTTARSPYIRGRRSKRIDPEMGALYRLDSRLRLFAHYQQGFRTGGLAVAPGVGRVANFENDTIHVGEVGARLVRNGATGIAAVAAVSYARWNDIQADLVSMAGFPYTANVGNGRIAAFEGSIDWVPIVGLRLNGALFLNRSRLVSPRPDFASSGSRPLPATPPISATASFVWTRPLAGAALRLEGNARYVGESRLGVGPVLDLPYGDYVETGVGATLRLPGIDVSLSVDNPLGVRGNRFAIGNPFGVAYRDEVTPLRPRTIRVGTRVAF